MPAVAGRWIAVGCYLVAGTIALVLAAGFARRRRARAAAAARP